MVKKKYFKFWWIPMLLGVVIFLGLFGLFGQSFASGGMGFGSDEFYPSGQSALDVCEKAMVNMNTQTISRYKLDCGIKSETSRNLSDERCDTAEERRILGDANKNLCDYTWYTWKVYDVKGIDNGGDLLQQVERLAVLSLKHDVACPNNLLREYGLGTCSADYESPVDDVVLVEELDVVVDEVEAEDSVNEPPVFEGLSGGVSQEDAGEPNYLLFWIVVGGLLFVVGLVLFFVRGGKK